MSFKKIRKTNYEDGTILEITECTFHPYFLGEKVKVLNKDNLGYHVVNITNTIANKEFYWVTDKQVKKYVEKM